MVKSRDAKKMGLTSWLWRKKEKEPRLVPKCLAWQWAGSQGRSHVLILLFLKSKAEGPLQELTTSNYWVPVFLPRKGFSFM